MIISASRRTDIPAFYSDWFIRRLQEGFLYVRNPFNARQIFKIVLSPDIVECIVFWSKNPAPLLKKLHLIDRMGYKYYFQFTITSYDSSIEKNVPAKEEVIETFIKLSEKIGKHKVIWRYDPIFLTDKFDINYHVKWFEYLASKLSKHTDKCIISFIDMYKKCQNNMKDICLKDFNVHQKRILAKNLAEISESYGLKIESCAEDIDLEEFGIKHGKCIDDKLISRIVGFPISAPKDKNQRSACGCVESIDIGAYNTCKHACKYCYANYSQKMVQRNIKAHEVDSPLITGKVTGNERIINRKIKPLKKQQLSLLDIIAQRDTPADK